MTSMLEENGPENATKL